MTPQERLFGLTSPEPNTGCWLWMGSYTRSPHNKRHYGQFNLGGKIMHAHRASFRLWCGTIPAGLVIDHLCRTPECVNPAHLEAVTVLENNRRGARVLLTTEEVASIYMDGRPMRTLAAMFGVTFRTIESIKYRQAWRDVTANLGIAAGRKRRSRQRQTT